MQYRVIRNSNKMRLSCNGCRVLRKGCSDDCSIRPCLDWIKCPYKQANATVFLAKFYGRAGLLNLIHGASPDHRPAIFRSLLYEACGRILDPIFGSVGLLWSGSWQLCHDAVEAVLRGDPITRITSDAAEAAKNWPPLKAYDIRHVNKADEESGMRRVRRRCRFSSRGPNSKRARVSLGSVDVSEVNRSPSHESSLSHQSEAAAELKLERVSVETALNAVKEDDGGIELDLRLGYEPFKRCVKKPSDVAMKRADGSAEDDAVFCKMQLGLDYWAS